MRTEMDGPPPNQQAIQRTAYQEPSAPAAPTAPSGGAVVLPDAAAALPQVINLNPAEPKAEEPVEEQPASPALILPPPPMIAPRYEAPANTAGPKH
jgi:hypothetical protein